MKCFFDLIYTIFWKRKAFFKYCTWMNPLLALCPTQMWHLCVLQTWQLQWLEVIPDLSPDPASQPDLLLPPLPAYSHFQWSPSMRTLTELELKFCIRTTCFVRLYLTSNLFASICCGTQPLETWRLLCDDGWICIHYAKKQKQNSYMYKKNICK